MAAPKTHIFRGVHFTAPPPLPDPAEAKYKLELDTEGVGGLITVHTPMGDVVARFRYDSERAELALTVLKKPALVPTAVILAVTSQMLRSASGS